MAIYHLSGTVISRSQGRSAVACAAYRSGERLMDERYDTVHDYSRKQDVAYTEILLPEGAAPSMSNREQLWNAVEASEKRIDSQLAREFNFALPKELTLEQNIELARAYVKEQFVARGMVADLCIHMDKAKNGELQPHAHIMLTMREVNGEGFGQKVRAWNEKALLLEWREAWAEKVNYHLALNGHDVRIDHRSLSAQGIALEPQYKIGASEAFERMARFEDHQRIARENGEKLFNDPTIALKALTQQQSTFTHHDIARFVNRHTVDAEQFEKVYERVKGAPGLVYLGLDDKNQERHTTEEMLKLEVGMLKRSQALGEQGGYGVSDKHIENALAKKSLSFEQQEAFRHLTHEGRLKCVVGYAGSGKSYLLGAAREAWEAAGYRVQGVTLSGIAAETLEGSSGIESRTLASRLYYWEKGEESLGKKDILVVDEAGMLGSRQMASLLEEASKGGAKLVLIGDPQQLQAIEAGAAFRSIIERVNALQITEIRRQKESWQQEATRDLAQGLVSEALHRYDEKNHVHSFDSKAAAKESLIAMWNDARLANPTQSQIMLAYTRLEVQELNEKARMKRFAAGELGQDVLLQMERGQRAFAVQDRVYFLKNDRELGVMNGSLGTITAINAEQLSIRLDEKGSSRDRMITVSLDKYNHLDHGYAATIHKAQGVTVDRSYILASRYFDGHASYVAMSRHRESMDLFWSREEFPTERQLSDALERDRSKDVSVDYNQDEFAKTRGIGSERVIHPEGFYKDITKRDGNYNYRRPNKLQTRNDLAAFKERFEAENPERAKLINTTIASSKDKETESFVHEFTRLQARVKQGGRSHYLAEHSLKQLVDRASRQPELMQSLKERHEPIAKELELIRKTLSRERDLGREL